MRNREREREVGEDQDHDVECIDIEKETKRDEEIVRGECDRMKRRYYNLWREERARRR